MIAVNGNKRNEKARRINYDFGLEQLISDRIRMPCVLYISFRTHEVN